MDKSNYFDFKKWDAFLKQNFPCAKLVVEPNKDEEKVYVTDFFTSSFQVCHKDFIESHSFTKGGYTLGKSRGVWEEFRLRVKNPEHFVGDNFIPQGKYRIRVQALGIERPVIKTFVRKSFFGILYWSAKDFPKEICLKNLFKDETTYLLD